MHYEHVTAGARSFGGFVRLLGSVNSFDSFGTRLVTPRVDLRAMAMIICGCLVELLQDRPTTQALSPSYLLSEISTTHTSLRSF